MSLYLRNDRRRARSRLLIATIIVIALFLIDALSGGAVRAIVRTGGTLLWRGSAQIESAIFGSGFFSTRRAMQSENEALRREIAVLESEVAGHEGLLQEIAELRKLVRLAESSAGVTAPIISSTRSSPYGTFLIGAGVADGLTVGNVVLAAGENGFAVGEIADVHQKSALVREVFAPGVTLDGRLRGADLSFEGQGGGNARATAPRALAVAEGDPVTSGLYGGRLIGVVGSVSSDSASAYKSVYVRTPVSVSELQFVYVVPNSQ